MPIREFRDVRPGGNVSASEFNRLQDEAARSSRLTASPPLSVRQEATGYHIQLSGSASASLGVPGIPSSA